MQEMTPREIVAELDKYIIGQENAKKAIAVAIRNRWRRQQVDESIRKDIGPKNMMMIGPTGVGKTEIARRLATLTGAPFIKVEATKYTEVGYFGRDVESMVRDLVENAVGIVRTAERKEIESVAEIKTTEKLVELLLKHFDELQEKRNQRIRQRKKASDLSNENKTSDISVNTAQQTTLDESKKSALNSPESVLSNNDAEQNGCPSNNSSINNSSSDNNSSSVNSTNDNISNNNDSKENSSNENPFEKLLMSGRKIEFDPNNPTAAISEMMEIVRELFPNGNPFIPQNSADFFANSSEDKSDKSANKTAEENANKETLDSSSDSVLPTASEETSEALAETDLDESPLFVSEEEIRRRLLAGELEKEPIILSVEQKRPTVMMSGIGLESMDSDLQGMFERIIPKRNERRELSVEEARKIIFDQECEKLISKEKVNQKAVELAETMGIIFIDEIDKIVASEQQHGADVSRQGVQRDLLPIVEGTTVQTKYGFVSTDHILFIAAGAFHRTKPSDLMPELQGRFPIRVELTDLTKDDFVRILTEPKSSLTKQYIALLKTEGVDLHFEPEAINALAQYAFDVNQSSQNIGARRLYTIVERLLEELSFEAPDMKSGHISINADYVAHRLNDFAKEDNLERFML